MKLAYCSTKANLLIFILSITVYLKMWRESEPKEPEPENQEALLKKISRRKLLVNALCAVAALSGSCSIINSCDGQSIRREISSLERLKGESVSFDNIKEDNPQVIPKDNSIIILTELEYLYTKKLHAIVGASVTVVIGVLAAFFARKIEEENT